MAEITVNKHGRNNTVNKHGRNNAVNKHRKGWYSHWVYKDGFFN
jgi:hypothetical protein